MLRFSYTARRQTIHSHSHRCIARYKFIPLNELGRRGEDENAQSSKQHTAKGIRSLALSQFRVRYSTAELYTTLHAVRMHDRVQSFYR